MPVMMSHQMAPSNDDYCTRAHLKTHLNFKVAPIPFSFGKSLSSEHGTPTTVNARFGLGFNAKVLDTLQVVPVLLIPVA